ncbi:peptidase A8 [Bifidobacterium stellenboschense]|uniref:Lipoprotein signal peptidase n=2 Tax=Bifidobacterium stellenboschense TaxID=762211 RepID=A0A087DHC8_9BIFI|nr:peptidase A8 [Bifidobacterium stellenboschense]
MNMVHHGRPRIRVAVFACLAVIALAVDQLTKLWALSALSDGRTVRVIPGLLSLTLVRNPGASLGFGSGATWVISLLAIVASVALVVLAWRTTSMAWSVTFAFAFAGAFGNLIDRVVYADGFLDGRVVDFLNYGWSVGNVADIFLMVAGVAIVLMILFNVPFGSDARADAHDAADAAAGSAAEGGKA